jgi:hypothetical protein
LPDKQPRSLPEQVAAPDTPRHATAASPPGPPASSSPPGNLSEIKVRIAQAEASFNQQLERVRREAEGRYEKKEVKKAKPLPWWKRWAMRIMGFHGRSES